MRIRITVNYDGTEFCGWQKQKDKRTVQETLESAVFTVTGEKTSVIASGRTDSGVHAEGQVAHFEIKNTTIPPENFRLALNAVLPPDVKVLKSQKTDDDFHARRNAKIKTYRYSVYISDVEIPTLERYATRINDGLDMKKAESAAKLIEGEHDFKSFMSSGSAVKTTVRTVYEIKIEKKESRIDFFVTGNGFLYNMVRIIVGTILKVAYGKATEDDLKKMLSASERALGGKTLPAKGLTLVNVVYE